MSKKPLPVRRHGSLFGVSSPEARHHHAWQEKSQGRSCWLPWSVVFGRLRVVFLLALFAVHAVQEKVHGLQSEEYQ